MWVSNDNFIYHLSVSVWLWIGGMWMGKGVLKWIWRENEWKALKKSLQDQDKKD